MAFRLFMGLDIAGQPFRAAGVSPPRAARTLWRFLPEGKRHKGL